MRPVVRRWCEQQPARRCKADCWRPGSQSPACAGAGGAGQHLARVVTQAALKRLPGWDG